MDGQILRCLPFDATHVRSGWMWWTRFREVKFCKALRIVMCCIRTRNRNDVEMVQEYPEDFLGNIHNFLAPNTIWSGYVHLLNEAVRLLLVFRSRILQVFEDDLGLYLQEILWCHAAPRTGEQREAR